MRAPRQAGGRTGRPPRPAADPRRVALHVLRRVEEGGAWADRAFSAEARRAGLEGRDRALAARLAFGTVQRRRTLDHCILTLAGRDPAAVQPALRVVLRLGAYQLLYAERIPAHAAVSTTVGLVRAEGPGTAGFVNAVLRRVAEGGPALLATLPDDTPAAAAVRHSYPDWIPELWWEAYGPETARALLAAGNEAPEQALRVNALRPDARGRVEAELAEAGVPWHGDPLAPAAIVLDAPFDVAESRLFRTGDAVPMSRAAQRVTALLPVAPGMRVLDACAAPGGKSGQLAAALGGADTLVCVDRDPARARVLTESLDRQGAAGAEVVVADATELPARLGRFDAILLDAPCSGLGVVSGRPDLRWRRGPDALQGLVDLQERLLAALVERLAPGGRLVYSVCTLNPAESGEVVGSRPREALLETWPHRGDGDGFWAALVPA